MDRLDDGVIPGIWKALIREVGVNNVQQRNPDRAKTHFDDTNTKTVSTACQSTAHTADISLQCFTIDSRDCEGTAANAR